MQRHASQSIDNKAQSGLLRISGLSFELFTLNMNRPSVRKRLASQSDFLVAFGSHTLFCDGT